MMNRATVVEHENGWGVGQVLAIMVLAVIGATAFAIALSSGLVAGVASGALWRRGRWWIPIPILGGVVLAAALYLDEGASVAAHVGEIEKLLNLVGPWIRAHLLSETPPAVREDMVDSLGELMRLQLPLGVLLGPLVGGALRNTDRVNDIDRERKRAQSKHARAERIAARKAKRSIKSVTRGQQPLEDQDGIALGHAFGTSARRRSKLGRKMFLSWNDLREQILVFGSTGSGKTMTALRIAVEAAQHGYLVIFLDAKGSESTAAQFVRLIPTARVCPDQTGWNFFVGAVLEMTEKIMSMMNFSEEYYQGIARKLTRLALEAKPDLPTSFTELVERVRSQTPAGIKRSEVEGFAQRLEMLEDRLDGKFDGGRSFDDGHVYFRIDSLTLFDAAPSIAMAILLSLSQWIRKRPNKTQPVLLVVDEMSAIGRAGWLVAGMLERLREFDVSVVITSQSLEGLADDETDRGRMLGAVPTYIVQQMNNPEEFVSRAGTYELSEATTQIDDHGITGMGSLRGVDKFKLNPNTVRGFKPGEAAIIRKGEVVIGKIIPPALPATHKIDPTPPEATPINKPSKQETAQPDKSSDVDEDPDTPLWEEN